MNSLPPELLSSIINLAADCSSIYESWDTRMHTLLSLTLVNKAFHEIAQPLVPQKFYFKEDDDVVGEPFEDFMKSEVTTMIESLTFEPKLEAYYYKLPILFGFENLTELRITNSGEISLDTFRAYHHLSRLSLYGASFSYDPDLEADISLCSLSEFNLESTDLASKALNVTLPDRAVFSDSLIARLDCLTTNDKYIHTATPDLPIPVPHLFDIRTERSPISLTANGPTGFLKFKIPSFSYNYLRIRLPCEPISSHEDIKSALEFAHKLVEESTDLEELYLDIYPRDGRRGYVLEKELEEKTKKLEEIAREKEVEIIWENHQDDWCRSRVSKEFWRRSKEKKKNSQAK